RDDIRLVSLEGEARKDRAARLKAHEEADVSILCLPDAAVHEVAADLKAMGARIIDASTAHRTDPDWVYGFPEMAAGQRAAIAGAQLVSNPGCWATCVIALVRPLV